MSRIQTLNRTEAGVETARGLLDNAHFCFDAASPQDWANLKPAFGFLLNAVSAELTRTSGAVTTLYRERGAANANGRGI